MVALIDSGINPYHDAFQAQPGGVRVDDWLHLAPDAEPVTLSRRTTYDRSVEADSAFWSQAEEGKLYAFSGTRVFAVSTGRDSGDYPILDDIGHGAGTASMVALEDPNAIIVMVQASALLCNFEDPVEECPLYEDKFTPSLAWIASQPWIDLVSLSIGYLLNPPTHPAYAEGVEAWVETSRQMADGGRLILNGAGNDPTIPFASQYGGLPWVIAVGGAEGAQGGEQASSSRGGDVIANFSVLAASEDHLSEWDWWAGTSYSTPITAGVLSRALYKIRDALGHRDGVTPAGELAPGVRAGDLRQALNASAILLSPTDWDPTTPPTNDTLTNLFTYSLPAATPLQQGWGYVDGRIVPEIVRRVLEADLAPPPEKALTASWMAQWQSAREAYWDQWQRAT